MKNWGLGLGLGIELVAIESAAIYAGQYLDLKNNWPGYAITAGGLLGLTIWLAHVVMITKRFDKSPSEPE